MVNWRLEAAGAFLALHGPREHARRLLPEALGGARQHGEDLAVDGAPYLPGWRGGRGAHVLHRQALATNKCNN